MHPSHVKVPVMNWVLKVGPTGFVVEGKSLELRRIVDDQRPVRAAHIKKNNV